MRPASVGFQCPDCVAAGRASIRQPRRTTNARLAVARLGPVTTGLIAANVLAFLVTVATAGGQIMANYRSPIFAEFATAPILVADGEWWRMLSGAFLHYGLTHLAVNMFSLYVLGRDLEQYLGSARYAAVYFLSAIGGSVAVLLFAAPFTSVAGASGAIFGLLGATGIALYQRKANLRSLFAILAINVFISFLPGISLAAHAGGFLIGAAAGAIVIYGKRRDQAIVAGLIALGAVLIALTVLGAGLLLG
ncbi:MAG: rhomboid family intramembrane serine protease [Geodermatophilaceae bacterium]|nr:rhomboid family intramembrane serine protease [Geodermatophilaceae bacterium]